MIGRFISADTFATTDANGFLSCNMFAYCENDTVNREDATGEFFNTAIGAVVGAISGGINAYIAGQNPWVGAAIGAATGALSGAAVDIAIATGGVGAIAIAAIGGGISSGMNNVLNSVANHQKLDAASIAVDTITGAALNVLSLGVSTPSVKSTTGASMLKRIYSNSLSALKENSLKKVGGQLVRKSNFRNIVFRNIQNSMLNSGVISRGGWLISNTIKSYWGSALK